jgi:hypothetical protein
LHSCIIARNQKIQCYWRCFDSNGLAGTFSFGSIVINDTAQEKINHTTASPYPIKGIDPLFADGWMCLLMDFLTSAMGFV